MTETIALEIENLSHQYGNNKVLHNINLKIKPGQFVAMVGRSGCGKSTLLKAILGILKPTSGSVKVDGKEIEGPNRDVGVVLQQYPLYTSKTCMRNVAAGLMWDQTTLPWRLFRPFKWSKLKKEHHKLAEEALRKVHLDEKQFHKYPEDLSGGQQQRVAIAQALVMKPKVLLLDEPFGALDESTRESAQKLLQEMYQKNIEAIKKGEEPPFTVIIVTHELNEALIVSDRLIGLSKGWKYPEVISPKTVELTEGEVLKKEKYNPFKTGNEYGATKVYDRSTPIFHPDDVKDLQLLMEQKKEVREKVLNENSCVHPDENNVFWEEVKSGKGTGIHSIVH